MLQPLLVEARYRWQDAGVDVSSLHGIDIRITDLPGARLGMASGNTIWLDGNAAGWGWFVDPTPGDDSEFTTPGDQGEQGRMDLLTAIAHELGHLLSFEHSDDGTMRDTLAAGTRLTPGLDATTWWFALSASDSDDWLSAVATVGGRRKAR